MARVAVLEPREGAELFGPGSFHWALTGDRRFALMFGSAFVLQTMHPQIGAAVSKQSTFQTDPWGRAMRSLTSVLRWVYGGEGAREEARRLVKMHEKIRGTDDTGHRYDALEAEAWAWVPLTAFHGLVKGYPYFYGAPLSLADEEQAYREALQLCRILHVPEASLPKTVADYRAYFDDKVDHTLVGHPMARAVVELWGHAPPPHELPDALRFAWPGVAKLGNRVFSLAVVGLLPDRAREKLGLVWTARDERNLRLLGRVVARTFAHLPERARYMGPAYQARQAARRGARAE
jgi:uncharacterized protein (DUF2236 family)